MIKIQLTPKLLMFSAALLLLLSVHLLGRVWVPLPTDDKSIEGIVVADTLFKQTASDDLLKLLDSYSLPAIEDTASGAVAGKFDGKQLGDLYVSLFGIYRAGQNLKAILQIQNKTTNSTKLHRLGVNERIDELQVLHLDTRQIEIRYQQQDVTLILFNKSNTAAAAAP